MAEVSFGEWLRRRRKALDLTQEQLAQQISCSTSALRKIESEERRPSEQIVEQLAALFHIASNQRASFLKFARGNWEAAPVGANEDTSRLFSLSPEREPKTHLATFLFTDIEGSVKLWESAPEKMKVALQQHHEILKEAISSNGGEAFQIVGDAVCSVFPTAPSAISAAVTAQRRLHQEQWDLPSPIRVRMGIHTGEAERTSKDSLTGGYASNPTMNCVARVLNAGHGGQILLSLVTKELIEDSLPMNTALRDMGEHRLKNITRPEHLFQLNIAGLPSDFPPLNTLDSARHNLPLQLTSFIGREKEIADVIRLLEKARLVMLTGPGGTGKTRLSLQVANELLDQYPDGAWFVELAPISDPSLVASTIAAALNLPAEMQRPAIDMLCDYLREKELLIVLDNCGHLVEACAQMVNRLLHAAPKFRILASSREALGIAGEVSYRVPSLGLPDIKDVPTVESLNQYEAVQLFIERATSAVSTFSVTNENVSAIAQICHCLDGIPLAIELAAAKVRALSVDQIAKRLDDRFRLLTGGSRTALERHQTLRATLDWSHNLLSPEEQILFRRLSIFVNGWTLEGAESVCSDESTSDGIRSEDIQNLLEHLVNKSLVSAEDWQSETRYRMLETMRQYADEKLIEAGETGNLCERHLEYYLNLAESAAPHLLKPEQLEWLARLEAEHENIRAALERSLGLERPEYALRLAAALGDFWHLHCYWNEGATRLESALAKPAQELTAAEKTARARALYQDAELASDLDDLERLQVSAEASLALCATGMDRRDLAIARFYVGIAFHRHEDYENARPLLEQSLTEFRELKDLFWGAITQRWLSIILVARGEKSWKSWGETINQDLELARRTGERLNLASVLVDCGEWAWTDDQIDEAEAHLSEAQTLYEQIGNQANTAIWLQGLVAHCRNDYQRARNIYTKSKEQYELLGEKNIKSITIQCLGELERDDGNLQQAQSHVEEALKIAREVESKSVIGFRLALLGQIEFLQGNFEGAKRNFNESLSTVKEIGNGYSKSQHLLIFSNTYANIHPPIAIRMLGAVHAYSRNKKGAIHPLRKRDSDSAIAQAHQHLDESAFNAAWAEGEKMSLDEALNLALKTLEEM